MYLDRDWYRFGAMDFVTTATYMFLALIAMTSIEEVLVMVIADQINCDDISQKSCRCILIRSSLILHLHDLATVFNLFKKFR